MLTVLFFSFFLTLSPLVCHIRGKVHRYMEDKKKKNRLTFLTDFGMHCIVAYCDKV